MIYAVAAFVMVCGFVGVSIILFLFGCATRATQQAEEADDEFQDW